MTFAIQNSPASGFTLTPAAMQELGLQESDTGEVLAMAQRIQPADPSTVSQFGRDVAEHTARYTDGLLDQVRNADLDEAGAKLSQVVNIARTLNMGPLSDKRSRIPVVGPIIDKFRLSTKSFMGHFDTTRQQIETLIGEVQTTQTNIQARNAGLEEMFGSVRDEHRLLGLHIAAGRVRIGELVSEAEELRKHVGNDPARVQAIADMDALISNLDKRVGDLVVSQHAAMQSLPTIRIIQANNQMLVDKFHTIREITVPAWKRQFMLALALNEQRNAVQLANTIDDATNDLMKRNSALLYRNSVETAKANQRLVIDVETLKNAQDTLIKTVEDVLRIQREGVQHRRTAEKQVEMMRTDLRQRLSRHSAVELLAKNDEVPA